MRQRIGVLALAFSIVAGLIVLLPHSAQAQLCGYICSGPVGDRHCVEDVPSAGCEQTGTNSCRFYGNCWAPKKEQAGFWGPVAEDTQVAFAPLKSAAEPEKASPSLPKSVRQIQP